MTLEKVLSIVGPGLTTIGAALLTYDVFRAPARLVRQLQRTETLDAAERHRDKTAQALTDAEDVLATGEHEAEMAEIHASFASKVGKVKRAYDHAATREGDRAFRIAVWGLILVVLGGIAETVAAILAATGPTG